MTEIMYRNGRYHYARILRWFGAVVLAISLILISTFKLLGPDQDLYVYLGFLDAGNYTQHKYRFEPAASLFREVANNDALIFFFLFALLGIGLKILAFYSLSKNFLLVAFYYCVTFYLLHDYTQIRTGVATGIFLLCINDIWQGKWARYYLKAFGAVCFHYSALIIMLAYPILRVRSRTFFLLLPIAGILLALADAPINDLIRTLASWDIRIYNLIRSKQGPPGEISIFSIFQLSYLFMFGLISVYCHKLDEIDLTLFKCFSLSLFLYYATIPLHAPVITYRLSELLLIVTVVLVPNYIGYFKNREALYALVGMYSLFQLYHLLFNVKLLSSVST